MEVSQCFFVLACQLLFFMLPTPQFSCGTSFILSFRLMPLSPEGTQVIQAWPHSLLLPNNELSLIALLHLPNESQEMVFTVLL